LKCHPTHFDEITDHRRQKGSSHLCRLKNFKKILAVNNPVIVGVQTLVCAYAKLKLGFHKWPAKINLILSPRKFISH